MFFTPAPVQTTSEEFKTSFISTAIGLPSSINRNENKVLGILFKPEESKNARALRFSVDGKQVKIEAFRKQWHYNNRVIFLPEVYSNTNPKWPVHFNTVVSYGVFYCTRWFGAPWRLWINRNCSKPFYMEDTDSKKWIFSNLQRSNRDEAKGKNESQGCCENSKSRICNTVTYWGTRVWQTRQLPSLLHIYIFCAREIWTNPW